MSPVSRNCIRSLFWVLFLGLPQSGFSLGEKPYVSFDGKGREFSLSSNGKSAPLCASVQDHPGVLRVLNLFQADIAAVTGAAPEISLDKVPSSNEVVIIGTLGKSPLIDKLVRGRKINVEGVEGKWEAFLVQTVKSPFPGVDRALVIAGSDKRGTIYGMFDSVRADRRVALVLVGRRAGQKAQTGLCPARAGMPMVRRR